VSRREEQALALRLARALDGAEQPRDEVAALVSVLERATEPARFELTEDVVERELARLKPRLARPADRRPTSRIALAFGAAAAAAVAIVVFTFVRLPGADVEAKALAALNGVLEIHERIEPAQPGAFPVSARTVWLDPARGLEHTVETSGSQVVEETLVKPGRIIRFLPGENLAIVAHSCRAFASGCADTVDPVAFYRHALAEKGIESTKRTDAGYELTLPIRTLPDAVRIEQVVTIDARTYLPTRIEWQEQRPGGRLHAVSRIVIESIDRVDLRVIPDPFHLSLLRSTRIEQRTVSETPLRKLSERPLTLDQARQIRPALLLLPGTPLSVDEIRWNAGTVYRLRYAGDTTVWNYRGLVPPGILSTVAGGPLKVVPLSGNVVRFYPASGGRALAEVDTRTWSVAIDAPEQGKIDVYRAAQSLTRLR